MFFTGLPASYILVVLLSLAPTAFALLWTGAPGTLIWSCVSASVIIAISGLSFVSRNLNRSLLRLERAIDRIAKGELNTKVYPPRTHQLARLANGLNSMTSQLRERVTALTQLSDEQDAILRTLAEGVITVDKTGRVIRINDAAREILGIALDHCEGRLIPEVVHQSSLQEYINQCLTDSGLTSRIFSLPGTPERTIQAYGSPLKRGDDKNSEDDLGILVVLQDITRIENLERIRKDFVANVSHELKTPITAIKGFVETLIDGAKDDPPALTKFLGIIGHQADRLQGIFTDLLTLARLESQGYEVELEKSRVEVSDLVNSALRSLQHKVEDRNASIVSEIPAGASVVGSSSLLQQALTNLIHNAIEYSGDEPRVTIGASILESSVRITVSDNGPGIAKVHIPRLFERFYRIDPGRSRSKGGTGIGLAIVKHIAQVHRGTVDVESLPGIGSTFAITIPR